MTEQPSFEKEVEALITKHFPFSIASIPNSAIAQYISNCLFALIKAHAANTLCNDSNINGREIL